MSYSNRVNIHGYCSSSIYYFINCTFAPFFFSLFFVLNKLSNFSSPHLLLFPQMHTNTPTHKHIHTEIHLLKKKKKKHRYTNTPTHKQTHTDKQQRDRSVLDWNDQSSWVLLDRSSWVWVLPNQSLIGAGEISNLIDACGSNLGRSRSDLIWSNLIGACG